MDRGAQRATVHGVTKSRTQLTKHSMYIAISNARHDNLQGISSCMKGEIQSVREPYCPETLTV